jgi:hypothetical protein
MPKKLTTEQFIQKAKSIHGDKYDYSLVKYVNSRTKISIICKKHGKFNQIPKNHLFGKGCKLCYKDSKKLTTEQFIQKAKSIHGDKYDYSQTSYSETRNKVNIICKIHGSFNQRASDHLLGAGCKVCHDMSRTLTTEQFIQKAKSVHNNKYDYSLVDYVNKSTKVIIVCKKHGDFNQTPESHVFKKSGCPKCIHIANTKPEQLVAKHLDKLNINYIQNDRTTIKNPKTNRWLELDFFIPDSNLAIEVNGRYWHRNLEHRHKLKTRLCKEKDIKLIHLWEDEVSKFNFRKTFSQ